MMNQNNVSYQRNIIFTCYSVLSVIGGILFILFNILFILQLKGVIKEDVIAPKKEPEKRYTVNLKRQDERPKKMVDNINQNNQQSDLSRFLSDKNSKSVSNKPKETNDGQVALNSPSEIDELNLKKGEKGNSDDGKSKTIEKTSSDEKNVKSIFKQQSSIESMFGKPVEKKKSEAKKGRPDAINGNSFRNNLSTTAKRNGAEILGTNISLSTYAWEWYPYIQKMKEKIYQFWSVPPAYGLGLLYGASDIKITISRSGKMTFYKMVRHQGSKALQKSSEDVILAIFDLPPLPKNFPDPELGISIQLLYPRLK